MLFELIITLVFVLGPVAFAIGVDKFVDWSRKFPIF